MLGSTGLNFYWQCMRVSMNCDLIFFFLWGWRGRDASLNCCLEASLWSRLQFPLLLGWWWWLPNIPQELSSSEGRNSGTIWRQEKDSYWFYTIAKQKSALYLTSCYSWDNVFFDSSVQRLKHFPLRNWGKGQSVFPSASPAPMPCHVLFPMPGTPFPALLVWLLILSSRVNASWKLPPLFYFSSQQHHSSEVF